VASTGQVPVDALRKQAVSLHLQPLATQLLCACAVAAAAVPCRAVPCCAQVYYTGSDLTQVVWSTVRLSMKPSQQWLEGFVAQVCWQSLGEGGRGDRGAGGADLEWQGLEGFVAQVGLCAKPG
jgi:hypothetical protein